MRKQELIHVHGLLAEVADYCERTDAIAVETAEYDALDTRPTSIHCSKTDHKEAVAALGDAITTGLDATEERVPASAD
jgi:hypothetical protein